HDGGDRGAVRGAQRPTGRPGRGACAEARAREASPGAFDASVRKRRPRTSRGAGRSARDQPRGPVPREGGSMNARTAFLWAIRREWWEYRAVWIAPIVIAIFALIGFVFFIAKHVRISEQLGALLPLPLSMTASMILVTGWIVGIMYASDALHGDRRDRSI